MTNHVPDGRELLAQIDDLIKQATVERSHFYTASVLRTCRDYITRSAAPPPQIDQAEITNAIAWLRARRGYDYEAGQKYAGVVEVMRDGLIGKADDGVREAAIASEIIGDIEKRFPNWKSYRDLVDCIDVTLHNLRRGPQ